MPGKTVDILIPVGEKGGVENVINMTAGIMIGHGWNIRVVQLIWEGTKWVKEGIPYYPLLWGRDGKTIEDCFGAYVEFIKKEGSPDIILATGWPYACYMARRALEITDTDAVIFSWLHNDLSRYVDAGYGTEKEIVLADAHLAINGAIFKELKNINTNLNVIPVYNPIPFDTLPTDYDHRIAAGSSERHKAFFAGRLTEVKRPDVIIRAVAECEDWEAHIVGSGEPEYEKVLEKLVSELGVGNRVFFYGWSEKPWDIAAKIGAEVTIFASEYEGLALSAVESLACGIPIVTTPVGFVPELIDIAKTGYLYQFGDADGLAQILSAISAGMLPAIDPDVCRHKAEPYESSRAVEDFEKKLMAVYNEIRL